MGLSGRCCGIGIPWALYQTSAITFAVFANRPAAPEPLRIFVRLAATKKSAGLLARQPSGLPAIDRADGAALAPYMAKPQPPAALKPCVRPLLQCPPRPPAIAQRCSRSSAGSPPLHRLPTAPHEEPLAVIFPRLGVGASHTPPHRYQAFCPLQQLPHCGGQTGQLANWPTSLLRVPNDYIENWAISEGTVGCPLGRVDLGCPLGMWDTSKSGSDLIQKL